MWVQNAFVRRSKAGQTILGVRVHLVSPTSRVSMKLEATLAAHWFDSTGSCMPLFIIINVLPGNSAAVGIANSVGTIGTISLLNTSVGTFGYAAPGGMTGVAGSALPKKRSPYYPH
jgi:hypothetical protein